MALSAAVLATELGKIGLSDNESDVLDGWEDAWNVYFADAAILSGPISNNGVAAYGLCTVALKTALMGISVGGTEAQAAERIVTATEAFWDSIGTTPLIPTTLIWTTVPVLLGTLATKPGYMATPTTRAAFVSSLASTFVTNRTTSATASQALTSIANVIDSYMGGATMLDTTPTTPIIYTVT